MHMRFWVVLALALGASAGPGQAQPSTPPRILTMTGQGEVRAAPDTATLSAGVASTAPTAAAALAQNSDRMRKILAALKELGVADRDVQTANFSVSPQYANDSNNAPRLTGYRVENQLRVRLADVAALGATLDRLVAAGANQINGVDFAIRDSAPLLDQARAAAVADARARAQTYAKAAGVSLGAILSISEGADAPPRPVFMAKALARPAPIAAGEESLTANATIVWEIR